MTTTKEPVRHRWILAAVSMAPFCVQIDYFAMNLALPRMAIDLNSTATDLQWVISVYMLAMGIDLTGLALITVGIGLFTLTFDRAPTWGWLSPTTVIAFGCALAALVVFVVVENRARWPLVDLSLMHNPRFTVLVTLAGVGVAVSGTVLEMLQRAGMSPAGAVDAIVVVLAALLLPAGVVVLLIARASKSGT